MTVKPPADRLYGRIKGKKLRPRQEWLMAAFLPLVSYPAAPFAITPRETWLEVGFGGGEHAYMLATQNTDVAYIAAEVFENGICSLLSRLAPDDVENPLPPANLRLFTGDARPLIRSLPDAALGKLFLMFPDPWPKARHAKRRFVHPVMLPEIARVLVPGGEWRIASDDPTYQAWTDDVLAAQTLFTVTRAEAARPDGWPPTRYEAKAIAAGRTPIYWSLRKN
ncbi:MAG: tRNA (guanosine(46)-N7)-methyltransferase TrmB [Acidocella sp. 20-57-95]|nr:MAG: tRNA (guanosine(46)-N7)-methyltransferase TrmB [Acidocella sp. 20-57-95]OYV60671.1 MAG: tRNA (guanosine(46)-N7)-methyltransferase TrmB [Acidocella sp. 21-58-7]